MTTLRNELSKDAGTTKKQSAIRVLHVLDHSLPRADGYAIRSRGIVNGQRAIGFEPTILTSPLHEILDASGAAQIDGVTYHRTSLDEGPLSRSIRNRWPVIRELSVVSLLTSSIKRVLAQNKFDIIHAHSPALNAIAALRAARRSGIPVVYEIRAFWEDAAVDLGRTTPQSTRYRLTRLMEQYAARRASAVVGIASGILDDLRSRGIAGDKLFHVPNGVEVNKFEPVPRDSELAAQLGVPHGIPVLGFVGSFYQFEGIPWLVGAAAELFKRGNRFQLLIVGHGEDEAKIKDAITSCSAAEFVRFVGRVPPERVRQYYSLMDIVVYPRKKIRLTELVTPLKPLEAMAQRKAVLGSSVGGIRELIQHEHTGLLFAPESVEDFCIQAERLLRDRALRELMIDAGREMVLRDKNWQAIAERYRVVYDVARYHIEAI